MSYTYDEYTVNSPSRIKRYSHAQRLERTLRALDTGSGQRILDYGCGCEGHLLRKAMVQVERLDLYGYEPFEQIVRELEAKLKGTAINVISNTCQFEDGFFNRVACCEVLEHLSPADQRRVLAEIARLTAPIGGKAVVTVPIENGLSSLAKNIVRIAARQSHDGTSLATIIKSFLGMQIRDPMYESGISSHLGFYHRELQKIICESPMKVIKTIFSPFPLTRGYLNSQVIYVLQHDDSPV